MWLCGVYRYPWYRFRNPQNLIYYLPCLLCSCVFILRCGHREQVSLKGLQCYRMLSSAQERQGGCVSECTESAAVHTVACRLWVVGGNEPGLPALRLSSGPCSKHSTWWVGWCRWANGSHNSCSGMHPCDEPCLGLLFLLIESCNQDLVKEWLE